MGMTIPNVPAGIKLTKEDGTISEDFESFMIQLILYMQTNLSNEGYNAPPLTTTNIALLTNAPNGRIVYDSTVDEFKGKKAGVFKTFTLV